MKWLLIFLFITQLLQGMSLSIEPYDKKNHENKVTKLLDKKYKPKWFSYEQAQVLLDNETVVGFVAYDDSTDPISDETDCWINELKVDNNRLEYATILIKYLCQKSNGFFIKAHISKSDANSQKLYQHMGFSGKPVFWNKIELSLLKSSRPQAQNMQNSLLIN